MGDHCCDEMRRQVEQVCEDHPDRFDCPDCVVSFTAKFREYGLIIHDGGSSSYLIQYCPWCGLKLPESLRDRWFEELERLGFDPGDEEVPEEYHSAAWWRS